MNILALESTAKTASVAIVTKGEVRYTAQAENGLTHSRLLLPMVEDALKNCSLSIDDIDLFAATAGPGSFTGVRIGAAVLKGLAFGSDKPCVAISTLESLAMNLAPLGGLYCPVMDARREQVYTALFACENGNLTRLSEDSALSFEEVAALLKEKGSFSPVYLCGDGATVISPFLEKCGVSFKLPPRALLAQNAASTALCALKQ
ncbi:MAG: tRNA (adenosine(37)-N6)-threonylcarbamoyltransferase complex dimerization subunit type 1 TsaB, partial [Clostridia bacterium]|nr:tRNA (adenosine(37)-N6)-threonylcarbamoyltransferase complex dimerization subunit type 1 TsaB [Clostridia bacterium]